MECGSDTLLAIAIAAGIGLIWIFGLHVLEAKALTRFKAMVGRIVRITNLASDQYLQYAIFGAIQKFQ
jgi:hypothetical protein